MNDLVLFIIVVAAGVLFGAGLVLLVQRVLGVIDVPYWVAALPLIVLAIEVIVVAIYFFAVPILGKR